MADLLSRELHLTLPLSTLTQPVEQLSAEDMWVLREWLNDRLAEREDELMLSNPEIMAQIREAQAEYEAGDYAAPEELETGIDLTDETDV